MLHMCSLLALIWCNALHSCVHQLWPPVLPDCGWLIHFHLYTSRWEIPSVFPPFLFSGHSEWMNSARLKSFTPGHAQRGFSLTLTDSHICNSSSSSHGYTIAAAQELCHSNDTRMDCLRRLTPAESLRLRVDVLSLTTSSISI